MATKHNFKSVVDRYKRLKTRLPAIVGTEAVKFAMDNFRKQGFDTGSGVNKWPRRKPGAPRDKGRALLVDTGKGKRSIRAQVVSPTRVHITTDTDYMGVHNDGGQVTGTARVKAHVRRLKGGKRVQVKAHTRQVNFKMPQRQFIGPSLRLNQMVNDKFSRELENVFK